MAEFKKGFLAGKMNKDLDERLLPSGEYRDALNVRVTNSDGSDVGAVENIKGNAVASNILAHKGDGPNTAKIVGSVADTTHNKVYYFVYNYNELNEQGLGIQGDAIIEYDLATKETKVVFNDIYKVVGNIIASDIDPTNGPYLHTTLPNNNMFAAIKPGMDIDLLEAGQEVGDAVVEVEEPLQVDLTTYYLEWTSLPSYMPDVWVMSGLDLTNFIVDEYGSGTGTPIINSDPYGLSIVDGHFHVNAIANEPNTIDFGFKIIATDGTVPENGYPTPSFMSDPTSEDNTYAHIDNGLINFPNTNPGGGAMDNPTFDTVTGEGVLKIQYGGMSTGDYNPNNTWKTSRILASVVLGSGNNVVIAQSGLLTNSQVSSYNLDPLAQHQLTITQGLSGDFDDPASAM